MFFEKKSFLESVFGDLSRIKDCEINPEWIAENMKKDGIPFPHMYLAFGLDDPLLPPNRKFRDTMQKLGVDVTSRKVREHMSGISGIVILREFWTGCLLIRIARKG